VAPEDAALAVLELVITVMLVSLVKTAWNITPFIAKRYFVCEMCLACHIKRIIMLLSVTAKVIPMKVSACRCNDFGICEYCAVG
jgi:hypothetical protein